MSRTLLYIVLILGFALRLVFIFARPEGAMKLAPDEGEYYTLAQNLLKGNGFAIEDKLSAYRDFLFPAACSVLFDLANSAKTVFLFQAILDILTAFLIYKLAAKRFGEKIGIIGAAAWSFYPAAALFTALFMTETLAVFFWVLALYLYDLFEQSGYDYKTAAPTGICIGLLILTRSAGLVLLMSVLIYLIFIRYETPYKRRIFSAGVILVSCLAVLLPWLIRNQRTFDRFTLTTSKGINIYIGNNPNATGAYRFDSVVTEPLNHRNLTETEEEDLALLMAEKYVKQFPSQAASLLPRKFSYLWATDMSLWAHYTPKPEFTSLSAKLREKSIFQLLLLSLPYMLLVLFGTAGFFLTPHFPERGLFILQLFFGTVFCLLSYGLPRYHFPLMPCLVISGLSLVRPQAWNSAPEWRRVFLLTVLGMFLGIWLFEILTIAGY